MSKYRDINSNFINATDTDAKAIDNSIKNLILFRKYEVSGMPNMGSRLTELLFEEPGIMEVGIIKFEIEAILEFFEPRISVTNVSVTYENNKMLCDVFYTIAQSLIDEEQSVRLRLR